MLNSNIFKIKFIIKIIYIQLFLLILEYTKFYNHFHNQCKCLSSFSSSDACILLGKYIFL